MIIFSKSVNHHIITMKMLVLLYFGVLMNNSTKQFTTKIIKFFDTEKHETSKYKYLLIQVLFFAFLVYTIWSVFPISPIEADGVGIANGVEFMIRHGFADNEFTYRFPVQPGSYLLIFWISKIININAYLAFALISAVANIVLIFSSSYLLSKLTGGNFYFIGVLHFFFQEFLAAGAYANTTVIACSLILLGIIPLFKGDKPVNAIFSAILIGFGVFCRLDAGIIVIPFSILLIINKKKIPLNLLISGVLSILLFFFLKQITGISIQQITYLFKVHSTAYFVNENIQEFSFIGYKDVRSIISFFSIASLVLILLGLLHTIQQKYWQNFIFLLTGTVPFFCIFLGNLTSPRYILSTLPFFILAVYYGIQFLRTKKTKLAKAIASMLFIIFIGQYFFGIQVDVPSKPYREEMKPVIVNFLSLSNPIDGINNIKIVAGSGSSISTDDGYRLTSGIIYFPVFWHKEKAKKNSNIVPFNDFLETETQDTLGVLCNDYDACQFSKNLLLKNNYELTKVEKNVYKAEGINNVKLLIQDNGDDFITIQNNLSALQNDRILFISTIPATNYAIQSNIASLHKITDLVYTYIEKN